MLDGEALAKEVIKSVRIFFNNKIAPIVERLEAIEARQPEKGEKGDPGIDGKDGAPGLDGKDGRDGIDGKDGAPGERGEKGDTGLDGKDGRDGIDGIDGKDGAPGERGEKGDKGDPGLDGISIKDIYWEEGDLKFLADNDVAFVIEGEFLRGEKGDPGERGLDGRDGVNGTPGEKGADGRDGIDGINGKDGLDGRHGDPGRDGKDVDPETVEKLLSTMNQLMEENIKLKAEFNELRSKTISGVLIDEAGDLYSIDFTGSTKNLGRVRGKDGSNGRDGLKGDTGDKGLDGKDGRDGIDFDQFIFDYDEETKSLIAEAKSGDKEIRSAVFVPIIEYKGVFKENVDYLPGDVVTWAGSMWHCNRDTKEKPGDGSKDWTLCVKHGAKGEPGIKGDPGAKGLDGKDGKDLTQLGFDGGKY